LESHNLLAHLRRHHRGEFRFKNVREELLAVAAGGAHHEGRFVSHVQLRVFIHRRGERVVHDDHAGVR
jgi:hypothetical protein